MAYQGKLAKEVLDLSSDGYDKRGKVKEKWRSEGEIVNIVPC